MPVFTIEGCRILFLHVPKTGGSAVSAALQAAGEMRFDQPIRLGRQHLSPRHAPASAVLQIFDPGTFDFVFAVVRHPIARAISEYRYQRRKPGLHLARLLGFDAWLGYSLARFARDAGYRDNHFRPQTEYLLPGCRTFRYEDGLAAPLTELSAITGRKLTAGLAIKNPSPAHVVRPSARSLARLQAAYAADFQGLGYGQYPAEAAG